VLSINPQRKQEAAMSMYFYDETDDWPEYQTIKDDIHRLEKEHVEIRKKIQEAESASGPEDSDTALHAKVLGLKKKMKEIEQKLDGSLRLYR
jgi:predicted  nucleic acid-binding Zn-ribbon protein